MKIKTILVFACLMLLSGCNSQTKSEQTISASDFAAKIEKSDDAQILDVRTPAEFSSGHLVNAKNSDWNGSTFESEVSKLNKSKPVYVYCRSGKRSAQAAEKLTELGFSNVYNLEGGILQWESASLPVTTK